MSPINLLNNLVLMENFFGIYRNYCNQNKIKKCLIILLISTQMLLHTVIVSKELNLLLGEVEYNQINLIFAEFSASAYLSSLTFIMVGVYYSPAFRSYYESISRVSICFKDDNKFKTSLKRTNRLTIGFIIFSVVFAIFRSVGTFQKFGQIRLLDLVPILVSQIFTRIIVVYQDFMFYLVIMIVVNLLKSLISLVSVVQERAERCYLSSDEQCHITREQIQGWVELYQDLTNCCDKLMFCFGRQFFLTIILSILHNILMFYYMFYKNEMNIGNFMEYTRIGIVLLGYVSVMVMPLVAGQTAKNEGVKFRRVLVRLYNTIHIDSGEAEAKLIKDFIRMIKKNPIEINLMSKIPAGMYMLPVILSMAVNYLIVMLQFNHII